MIVAGTSSVRAKQETCPPRVQVRSLFGRTMGTLTHKKKLLGGLALLGLALGAGVCVLLRHRVQPEPPPRGATTPPPPFLERESSIRVGIVIDVGWIGGLADAKLPTRLLSRSDVAAGPGVKADVEVHRTGKIAAEVRDGAIHLRVPVPADIQARWQPQGWFGAPPWGDKRTLRLLPMFMIDARLGLDVDAEWNLATATEATLRWEDDPVVPIGPMEVPLSSLVGEQVREQFAEATRTIDARIGTEVPMRRVITDAWTSAFRSVALGPDGKRWLALQPTGLYMGDVQTRGDHVYVDAGVRGVFRVVFGEEPRPMPPAPLPARSAAPADPGMSLAIPVRITFEAANRELDAHGEGQVIELRTREDAAPALFTLETIDVYPSGAQVAVEVELSADIPHQPFDVSGRMYLLGTPTLDIARGEVRLGQLSYDARTNHALLDIAEWLLHAEILGRLEERLVFRFSERLEAYREDINAVIDDLAVSRSLRLHGALDELHISDLTITDAAIVALARLQGEAELEVRHGR